MTMLRTLSRLPSPKFDQQLATGDTHLDQYLQALDAVAWSLGSHPV